MNSKAVKFLTSKKFFEIAFVVVIFTSFIFWVSHILWYGEPSFEWRVFFLNLEDFQGDFTNVVGYSGLRDPYNSTYYTNLQEKAYPPLTYVVMYFISRIVDIEDYYEADYFQDMYTVPKIMIFIIMTTSATLIAFFESIRHNLKDSYLMKLLVSSAMLLTTPVIFSIERGNSIIFVIALMMAFIFGHDSENKVLKELSLIALAIAAALKMTPALLGILLIYKKDWKAVVRTVIYGLVMFFGPFLLLKGGFSNVSLMFRNIGLNMDWYKNEGGLTLFCALIQYGAPASEILFKISGYFSKLLCIVMLIAAFKFRRKSDVIMVLGLALIIFPDHSGYYNLLYLVPATVMLLNEEEKHLYDIIALVGLISFNHLYRFESLNGATLDYHTSVIIMTVYCIIITVANICSIKKTNKTSISSDEPSAEEKQAVRPKKNAMSRIKEVEE